MILCNISSDKIYISDAQEEFFVDRNDVDKILGSKIKKLFAKKDFQNVFLINGPGGFTNLRAGTLTRNLIAHLLGNQNKDLNFFSITKIDLYRYFVEKGILADIGYIYLGQKNAVWEYNFVDNSYKTINNPFAFAEKYFLDFVDDVDYFGTKEKMLNISLDQNGLFLSWNGEKNYFKIQDLGLQPNSVVSPEYFINPIG